LFTVLGKHASYIVRRIKHAKYNYLMLRRWEEYIQTVDYAVLVAEAENIVKRIEEKMAAEVKRKSIVTIRVVNKRFDELTYDKHLTPRCSGNIREYVVELLKKTLERF
jgi:GTPase Era involved in 16S rRNA processing